VLFIDASREYADDKKQNRLRDEDIAKVVQTFKDYAEIEKYSHRATLDELKEAEFNLNIPRYVDTFEEEEDIDIKAVQQEIEQLESELAQTQQELKGYLAELGLVKF
jgi:type I restriction enzyme M protein